MGRKSRAHREKRQGKARQLEQKIKELADGDAEFWASENLPAAIRDMNLEDILAFESVESGTSLFDGLKENGVPLPDPVILDEQQSAEKNEEVLRALGQLQIFLIGYDGMSARQFYSTLWNRTLWEGCYVRKRVPGAFTIIDVSHQLSRSEIRRAMERLTRVYNIQ